MARLIEVENLTLKFRTDEGLITAVENVSFSLDSGEGMGLVGESGSGKSVTAKALMHLNAGNAIYSDNSRITLHTETGPVDVLSFEKPADLKVVWRGDLDDLPGANGKLCAVYQHRQADGRTAATSFQYEQSPARNFHRDA